MSTIARRSSPKFDKPVQSQSLLSSAGLDDNDAFSKFIPVSAPSTPIKIVSSSESSDSEEDDASIPKLPSLSSSKKRTLTDRDHMSPKAINRTPVITPIKPASVSKTNVKNKDKPDAARRLVFGRAASSNAPKFQPNVKTVYNIVRKLTGSLGGNGYSGPIYGELTIGSMHKMIEAMIEHTGFDSASRFIDVGSGIGKPNLHVSQYPGVAFSCGVELEKVRWSLGMTCLKGILDAAMKERTLSDFVDDSKTAIQGRCMFLHRNITEANLFDPFTHVYMFSIGFPPPLWEHLSEMWNNSQSAYLICYHSPRIIVEKYEFNAELITQMTTSMHGSSEGHMGYLYRRTSGTKKTKSRRGRKAAEPCDPIFAKAWKLAKGDIKELHKVVSAEVNAEMSSGPTTRSRSRGVLTRD